MFLEGAGVGGKEIETGKKKERRGPGGGEKKNRRQGIQKNSHTGDQNDDVLAKPQTKGLRRRRQKKKKKKEFSGF